MHRSSTYRFIAICLLLSYYSTMCAQSSAVFKNTLPANGKFVNNKPVGKGWINLLSSPANWNMEKEYWQLSGGVLHGEANDQEEHHYIWTKKSYTDFELNV